MAKAPRKPSTSKKPASKSTPVRKTAAKKKPALAKKPATGTKPATRKPASAAPKGSDPQKPLPGTHATVPDATKLDKVPTPVSLAGASEGVYTLDELFVRTGVSDDMTALAYAGGLTPAEYVAIGRKVHTSRVTADAARLYGQALDFLGRATPAQRVALLALSDRFLQTAIWAARKGMNLCAAYERDNDLAQLAQKKRRATADAQVAQAEGYRDALHEACEHLAGDDLHLGPEIEAAYSKSQEATELAASLEKLCDLAERLLTSTEPSVVLRRHGTALSRELLTRVRELADKLAAAGIAAGSTRAAGAISQSEVDFWDGLNVTLLRRIIQVFNAGHQIDPTIPRLLPRALAKVFFRTHARPSPSSPTPPPTPDK